MKLALCKGFASEFRQIFAFIQAPIRLELKRFALNCLAYFYLFCFHKGFHKIVFLVAIEVGQGVVVLLGVDLDD